MVRSRILGAALLVLAALPVALDAQRPGGPGSGPALQMLQRNPIQVVLDARSELGLTEGVVARLEAVRDRLQEQNRVPLVRIDSLQQAMPRAERGNREATQAMMERIRPLRQEVQENNRRALEEIRPHLTATQWERVNELVQPRRRPTPDGS
jgi:Spy/CpxP family protein refolding chaperone